MLLEPNSSIWVLCGKEYMYYTHLQARVFDKYTKLGFRPKKLVKLHKDLWAYECVDSMARRSLGLYKDLRARKCVKSGGGEINKVTFYLVKKNYYF